MYTSNKMCLFFLYTSILHHSNMNNILSKKRT
nr:MAG TPA: hypothetical protein [Caudoviricetes sp.]